MDDPTFGPEGSLNFFEKTLDINIGWMAQNDVPVLFQVGFFDRKQQVCR
jgi:hypothetical protein